MLISVTKTGMTEAADEAVMAHFNLTPEAFSTLNSAAKRELAEDYVSDKEGNDLDIDFERQIKAIPEARGIEVMSGYLKINGQHFQIDFQVPIGATDAERDAAFMAALEGKGEIDYLSIGAITETVPKESAPMCFPKATVPLPNLQNHYVIFSKVENAFWNEEGPSGSWGGLIDAYIQLNPDLNKRPIASIDAAWMALEEATKLNLDKPAEAVKPTESSVDDEVPRSGPEMMRVALERVLSAANKGYVKGLYGSLLWYINSALTCNQPTTPIKGRAADVSLISDAEGMWQLVMSCKGHSISNPLVSECGRFDVEDPEKEYGIPDDFARAMGIINMYLKDWQK